MSKEKKSSRIKSLISGMFGIKEWKLNGENHLDISKDKLDKITAEYGSDFISKFEKLLSDESELITETNLPKLDMNLPFLCALLAVGAIVLSEDGNTATLNKEQLEKIEAGLKDLTDQKSAAESSLTTAKTEKDNAVSALTSASSAMDELDPTVAAAKTPAEKIEAIRTKLAAKPATGATITQTKNDNTERVIDGADAINDFAKDIIN